MSNFSELKLTVKISRWQPRSGRYRSVVHDLEDSRPILDILANNNGMRLQPDLAVEQMILRSQRVDRISIDATTNTVEIFMSPVVDRVYKKQLNLTGAKKASMSDVLCSCRHTEEQHSKAGGYKLEKSDYYTPLCLVPGCNCKRFERQGTRRELVDNFMEEL